MNPSLILKIDKSCTLLHVAISFCSKNLITISTVAVTSLCIVQTACDSYPQAVPIINHLMHVSHHMPDVCIRDKLTAKKGAIHLYIYCQYHKQLTRNIEIKIDPITVDIMHRN